MAATEEDILKLLDSYWFHHEILSSRKLWTSSSSSSSSATKSAYDHQDLHKLEKPVQKLSEIAKFEVRSKSDRCIRCNIDDSPDVFSPKSVIPFGKDHSFSDQSAEIEKSEKKKVSSNERMRKGKKEKKGISRSLSELEYDELKGFMDLGFVFTEEDRTSSLVSILPGLQRWGKRGSSCDEPVDENKRRVVSRPYLSEAWNVLNRRKPNKAMVNWKIPSLCNENNVKDQLKAWAHSVASYVR